MLLFKGFASKFKMFMRIIVFDQVWLNRRTFFKSKLHVIYTIFNKLKDSYPCCWKSCFFDDSKNSFKGGGE